MELNDNTKGFIKTYWQAIVIVIISIFLLISLHTCNNKSTEIDNIKSQQKIEKNIDKIDSGQKEILEKEKTLYPKINQKIEEIDSQIKENDKKVKDEEVKDVDINTLHNMFRQHGYSSSSISK